MSITNHNIYFAISILVVLHCLTCFYGWYMIVGGSM